MTFLGQGEEVGIDFPLVVDLDGTLIKSDTLHELANQHIFSNAFGVMDLIRWSVKGRAYLKQQLADRESLDVETLPYRSEVLAIIDKAKAGHRKIVLATASNAINANDVAHYLGVFDQVFASDEKINLKSSRKAQVLVENFGAGTVEYVGDSRADINVWRVAGQATLVGSATKYAPRIPESVTIREVRLENTPLLSRIAKFLRIHQWAKNLLIFLPLVVTHQFDQFGPILAAVIAFVAFSLAASGIYVINDLIDIPNDRAHETKRKRMLASGQVSILSAWMTWPLLVAYALILSALLLPANFTLILVTYVVVTLLYSLRLKRVPVIDVVTLAGLYTIRIVAGAAAISAPLSFWIMTFSLFLFLSLALMKRFSELMELRLKQGKNKVKGRGYVHQDLELVSSLGAGSGLVAVLVFMLYVQDPKVAPLYTSPSVLWLSGPLLLIWVARAWLIAHRGDMHEDPIVFAIRDRISYLIFASVLVVFIWATLF